MERTSEYVHTLSSESRARYVAKVVESGLKSDPYAIPKDMWLKELDVVPCVQWSDMFIYCVSTPSPYTREEIKVNITDISHHNNFCFEKVMHFFPGMERHDWR